MSFHLLRNKQTWAEVIQTNKQGAQSRTHKAYFPVVYTQYVSISILYINIIYATYII